MPPTRSQRTNDVSVNELRQRCAEKGLSTKGRKAILISRLQQHATTNPAPATALPPLDTDNTSTPATSSPGEIPQNLSLLNDAQMAQIQSIVSRSIEQSITEIASNAARAAVNAMQSSSQNESSLTTADHPAATSDCNPGPSAAMAVPDFLPNMANTPENESFVSQPMPRYGHAALDVPATYVKQIQSGEFFDLSKLLPREFPATTDEDSVVLTLENSIIKVKKANQPTQKITDIEQWTTAFTIYMGVLTSKFPTRSQELLQYMSLIRYASQTHRGLGWCIYDHKFRRKAAVNTSFNWSEIDQQLWLCIFTIPPEILRREYPLFSHGPQQYSTSSGAAKGGTCHEFNKRGECRNTRCPYRHACNKCSGTHPGFSCNQRSTEYDRFLKSSKKSKKS